VVEVSTQRVLYRFLGLVSTRFGHPLRGARRGVASGVWCGRSLRALVEARAFGMTPFVVSVSVGVLHFGSSSS
jgi:hypothetical protein